MCRIILTPLIYLWKSYILGVMKNNRKKGDKGEALAVKFLEDKGFGIVTTNYYASRYGEVDIIATDKNILVFIEVKTRTTQAFGHPLESISQAKLQKMRNAATFYIQENNPKVKGFRLDAIAITLKPELQIEHVKNI